MKKIPYHLQKRWGLNTQIHAYTSTQQGGSAVSTIDGEITETKQKQQYMGEYKRPDVAGRKFEPTFIFKK